MIAQILSIMCQGLPPIHTHNALKIMQAYNKNWSIDCTDFSEISMVTEKCIYIIVIALNHYEYQTERQLTARCYLGAIQSNTSIA